MKIKQKQVFNLYDNFSQALLIATTDWVLPTTHCRGAPWVLPFHPRLASAIMGMALVSL